MRKAVQVLFMVLGAQYLENIFIVNHIQDECAWPDKAAHWANKQVTATANWSSGSVAWNFISGGLNHQARFCPSHVLSSRLRTRTRAG